MARHFRGGRGAPVPLTLALLGVGLACQVPKPDCATAVARIRWLEDYETARRLHGFYRIAGIEITGAFVDLQVAKGKDALLRDPVFGLKREEIDKFTKLSVLFGLEWLLGKQAVFAIRSSETKSRSPQQTQSLVAEIKAMDAELGKVMKAAVAGYRSSREAGTYVKALDPPSQGGELRDALAVYRSFLVARMRDEMLQDSKRTLDRNKIAELTEEGVAQAYGDYAGALGCKAGK